MKNDNKIKVFESFAGVGTQRMALKRLGINFESVGISEIDSHAIKSYAAIHTDYLNTELPNLNDEEMYVYLEKINVPLNAKSFKNTARRLKGNKLKEMYLANKLSKNYGDISKINPNNLPDMDLFTYSFPCTDISLAGKQKGLALGSGTRSSLLWECEKIIKVKRPKYLLMENVKALVNKKFKKDFNSWLEVLKGYGYSNYWQVLNAKDYGVPQNRERVFCVSLLNKSSFKFPKKIPLDNKLKDILEEKVDSKYYLSEKSLNMLLKEDTGKFPRRKRFLENINKESDISNTIQSRQRTSPTDQYIVKGKESDMFIGASRGRKNKN